MRAGIVEVVDAMSFELVVRFADLMHVEYEKDVVDDDYPDREDDLRAALTDAFVSEQQKDLQRTSSNARCTKNEFIDYEYAYETCEELALAALREGRVCGDEFRWPDGNVSVEIFNHHQMSVRWKGTLKSLPQGELCRDATNCPM